MRLIELLLEFRQAFANGLLHDGSRFGALSQSVLERGNLAFQLAHIHHVTIALHQVAGRALPGLFERQLQAPDLNGVLGAQKILVGINVGDRNRHRGFDFARGESNGPAPESRSQQEGDQGRRNKTERDEHYCFDHAGRRLFTCWTLRAGTVPPAAAVGQTCDRKSAWKPAAFSTQL